MKNSYLLFIQAKRIELQTKKMEQWDEEEKWLTPKRNKVDDTTRLLYMI